MKKLFVAVVVLLSCVLSVCAQKQIEASALNLIGKPFESTPNPYHRVDTLVHKGFNVTENRQVRCSAGLAVLFKTNTRNISIATQLGYVYTGNSTMPVAYKGYDLYIKNADGQWQYAASGSMKSNVDQSGTFALIENMDGTMHECMMYMPMYSEVLSCKLIVDDNAVIEPLESPFRHKIVVYGSSFTQGVSTDRSGMSYPMQFMRSTGLQIASLATSGRCMMQPYMTDLLEQVKADAFIFDTFSNPDSVLISERLMSFVDRLVAAHPNTPLIFQRTIYRERRSFDTAVDAKERAKAAAVEALFAKILVNPKYKDVYLITPNASDSHETSVDGTHPNCYGYTLWAKSIEPAVIEILSKYNIK